VHALSDVLSMECRPFNINVMLVNAGAVKSNIANNALSHINLSADSLYAPFVARILERKPVSQSTVATPTIVFAKKVVAKALKARPPVHLLLGGYVIAFTVLKWLPKTWVLSLMWNRFLKKE
jgi:1-acylglycerone phosphate reductase